MIEKNIRIGGLTWRIRGRRVEAGAIGPEIQAGAFALGALALHTRLRSSDPWMCILVSKWVRTSYLKRKWVVKLVQ